MADLPERTASDHNEEIMRATYRALCEHGYADLTIKRIAAEYGKSTAAIHYHYDTKEDLLAAYLDYLLDRFVATIKDIETTDPDARLELLLDKLLVKPKEYPDLVVSMLEMGTQAPYKKTFRERFQQHDEYVRYTLKAVINHGIDEGVFDDVDATHAARTLMTIIDGARTRAVVLDDTEAFPTARRMADEYVSTIRAVDTSTDS